MKRFIVMVILTLCTSQAFAYDYGYVSQAKVTQIRVDRNGRAMIFFDQNLKASPEGAAPLDCVHSSYKSALAIDTREEGSAAVLSMALAAKATGALVTAYGNGQCGIYGGNVVETWNYGEMK